MSLIVAIAAACVLTAQSPGPEHHVNVNPEDMKWEKIFPDLGADSPEIVILHTDPTTKATELMIRVPKNFRVPPHWHSANETHTILEGTFVFEAEGKRGVLKRGGFNYVPKKMTHEAWTTRDEGALLFITVDGAWDVNFVNGPPKPGDMLGKGVSLGSD
jgi:quercetin dioxygenase-like cupin family protein